MKWCRPHVSSDINLNVRSGIPFIQSAQSFVIHLVILAIRPAVQPAKCTPRRLSPRYSSVSFSPFSINPRYNFGFTVMRVLARIARAREGRCNRLLSRRRESAGYFCASVKTVSGVEEELRGSFTICIKVDQSTRDARAFVSLKRYETPFM